jgi:hypothetical protein
MKNYRYLNLNSTLVNFNKFFSETRIIKEKAYCGSWFFPGKWGENDTIFSDSFKQLLEKANCKILKAEGFRVFPNTALAWHNDSNDEVGDLEYHKTTKINFMWGDLNNCYMEYGEPTDVKGKSITTNGRGRKAYVYDNTYMAVNERFSLNSTVLINRGPAHRIVNESSEDWLCLSCIIKDLETNKLLDYDEALIRFKEHIKILPAA